MATLAQGAEVGRGQSYRPAITALVIIAAGGLTLDAYVHLDLASRYAPIKTSVLSQATLFRLEAVVAIIAAIVLLIRPRRYTAVRSHCPCRR